METESVGLVAWITANWDVLITTVLAVVGAAAAIAAITPTPKDDKIVSWVRKAIDLVALNVGNAKNAPPKAPE